MWEKQFWHPSLTQTIFVYSGFPWSGSPITIQRKSLRCLVWMVLRKSNVIFIQCFFDIIMSFSACSAHGDGNEKRSFKFKSVLNLQMTYIIIAHIYEQWDRWGTLLNYMQRSVATDWYFSHSPSCWIFSVCLSALMLPENSPNDADYLRRAYSCFGPEISPSATFQITNYVGYG